jgi:hypothetical protein
MHITVRSLNFITLLLFIAILIVIVSIFGIASSGSTVTKSPTSQSVNVTPTSVVIRAQDPIIGVWRYGYPTGYNDIFRFNPDGTYVENFYDINTGKTEILGGTWSAQGINTYETLDTATNNSHTFIYSSIQNGIFSTEHPTILLTPFQGAVMTAKV